MWLLLYGFLTLTVELNKLENHWKSTMYGMHLILILKPSASIQVKDIISIHTSEGYFVFPGVPQQTFVSELFLPAPRVGVCWASTVWPRGQHMETLSGTEARAPGMCQQVTLEFNLIFLAVGRVPQPRVCLVVVQPCPMVLWGWCCSLWPSASSWAPGIFWEEGLGADPGINCRSLLNPSPLLRAVPAPGAVPGWAAGPSRANQPFDGFLHFLQWGCDGKRNFIDWSSAAPVSHHLP